MPESRLNRRLRQFDRRQNMVVGFLREHSDKEYTALQISDETGILLYDVERALMFARVGDTVDFKTRWYCGAPVRVWFVVATSTWKPKR